MDKFQAAIEMVLVPVATKLNSQRHICAVRDAFVLLFPLTMSGSLMILLNYVLLSPDGFIARMLHLGDLIPNLASYQAIFTPVLNGSTNILSILTVFLVGRNIAKDLKADDLLTGLTALSVFFIIYPSYVNVNGTNHLVTTYLGAQGLFVAIIVGLAVGEVMARLSKADKLEIKMPPQVPPAVSRSFKVLIPIIITTTLFSIINYIILKFSPEGINGLIYTVIQKPLTSLGGNISSVIVIALVQNVLWILGIHGPNTLSAIRSAIFTEADNANLLYVAQHGSSIGAPYPVTWGAMNDAFANIGGSGCTLGLVIAILLFSKAKEQRGIAKLSLAPGIFNINEPVIFGLPIVLNPIYIVPFVLTPIANILVGYTAVVIIKIIPPVSYGVPWTTPGPLIPFLGSGGSNIMSLVIGFICLLVSIAIYSPFVIAASKAEEKNILDEQESQAI